MITQKQMRLWIPEAISIFKKYMPVDTLPGGTLPEIYIGAPRNILKLRAELVEKTKSHQFNTPDPYDSIMEMIHGDAGDAILIQQKLVLEGNMADINFCHTLWHELGHYFAIYSECDDRDEYGASALHHYNNPGLQEDEEGSQNQQYPPTRHKQEGYWFWSEFIAEVIANYVDEQHCSIDNAEFYHPEKIVWEPHQWGYYSDSLMNLLEAAFDYYPTTIDEAALALYFATLLTKDVVKRYVKAAEDGELLVYDNEAIGKGKLKATKLMEPGSIEATCISDVEDTYQEILWDMKAILERQLRKEEFWKIDEHFLEEIGGCISLLMGNKLLMLSAEFMFE